MTFETKEHHELVSRLNVILSVFGIPVYVVLFLFLPAGTWAWTRGWLFLLVVFGALAVSNVYLWRVNPDVVAARTRFRKGTKIWDKILLAILFPSLAAISTIAALDDARFHWFPVGWWVCILGYILLVLGIGGLTWAESVNKFFEVTVRLQADRGQKVIDTGPYRIVRHPGYVSGAFMVVGMALSLGSLWALVPAGIGALVLIVRTKWEDQMLRSELPGYTNYSKRVRFRLIPGVW